MQMTRLKNCINYNSKYLVSSVVKPILLKTKERENIEKKHFGIDCFKRRWISEKGNISVVAIPENEVGYIIVLSAGNRVARSLRGVRVDRFTRLYLHVKRP